MVFMHIESYDFPGKTEQIIMNVDVDESEERNSSCILDQNYADLKNCKLYYKCHQVTFQPGVNIIVHGGPVPNPKFWVFKNSARLHREGCYFLAYMV